MTGAAPDPGWYPDPQDRDRLRYWSGITWTEHARAVEVEVPTPAAPQQPPVSAAPPAFAPPVSPAFAPPEAPAFAPPELPAPPDLPPPQPVDPPAPPPRAGDPALEALPPPVGVPDPEPLAPAQVPSQVGDTVLAPSPGPTRGPLIVIAAVVALIAVGVAGAVVLLREDDPGTTVAAPVVTPRELTPGAAYVETTEAPDGDLPLCVPEAARWQPVGAAALKVTVAVQGPKQVSVVATAKVNPERPTASRAAAQIPAKGSTHTFRIPAPEGGVGRVQVAIQGAEGLQRCLAAPVAR